MAMLFNERGYGVRDLHSENQDRHAYEFRLASFTKQFTAMAIMLLVHDGKLRYDETLARSFPIFPVYGKSSPFEISSTHFRIADYETDGSQWKNKRSNFGRRKTNSDAEVSELLKKREKRKIATGGKLGV